VPQDENAALRRRRFAEARKPPRHESAWWRPTDFVPGLNVSATTSWRIRQLPGCPKPNPLGRYNAADVLTFVATLDRHALRSIGRGRVQCATDAPFVESRGGALDCDPRTTHGTMKTAPAEPAQPIEAPAGPAPRATRNGRKARR
jgi:hypothetical protein